jgi:hypothetical protein
MWPSKLWWIIFGTASLSLAALLGFLGIRIETRSVVTTAIPAGLSNDSEVLGGGGANTTKTYSNEQEGFAIVYPAGWYWNVTPGDSAGNDWQIEFDGTTTEPDGIRDYVYILVDVDPDKVTDLELLNNEQTVNIGGAAAIEGTPPEPELSHENEIIVHYAGRYYQIHMPAHASESDKIVETIKFIR